MSVPEIPSNIYSPEERVQVSLRRVYILIYKLLLDLTKSQERLQNIFGFMVAQNQNFKLQMKP